MEHFHFWHAEAALRAARTVPKEYGIGGVTAYGTLLGESHYDGCSGSCSSRSNFTDNERLPQYATEAVLRARAAELPAVTTMFGWVLLVFRSEELHQLLGPALGGLMLAQGLPAEPTFILAALPIVVAVALVLLVGRLRPSAG